MVDWSVPLLMAISAGRYAKTATFRGYLETFVIGNPKPWIVFRLKMPAA